MIKIDKDLMDSITIGAGKPRKCKDKGTEGSLKNVIKRVNENIFSQGMEMALADAIKKFIVERMPKKRKKENDKHCDDVNNCAEVRGHNECLKLMRKALNL